MTIWNTHGLWEKTAEPAPSTQSLPGDSETDVVIIGAGYVGLSAALHLAEAGVRVIVLEGKTIGYGGSGRNSGLLNGGLSISPQMTIDALGTERGENVAKRLGDAPSLVIDLIQRHDIKCDLQQNGTLHCAVGEEGKTIIQARTKSWLQLGAPVEFLDAKATEDKTGSPFFTGALWDHRAGTLQPLSYVRGLAKAAIAAGVRIYTNSPVKNYVRDGMNWLVQTPKGHVKAKWLLLCTNAFTNHLEPALDREMVLMPYFNIATTPLDPEASAHILPENQGCWNTLMVPTSFRKDRKGRLVIGSVGAPRTFGASIHTAWARREIARLFPDLGPVELETGWHGVIGITKNRVPRIRQLGEQALSISGFSGRGIAPGTLYGKDFAEHILGKRPAEDLLFQADISDPQPLRKLHALYYETGAKIAHATMARSKNNK